MLGFLSRYAKVIVAVFALAMFGITQTDWFRSSPQVVKTEGNLIDRRYLLRGFRAADQDIQIIGIEGSSLTLDALSQEEIESSEALRLMNNPFPWDRRIYALLLDKLMAAGAKGVVFDFVFKSPTPGDVDFAAALHKYKDKVTIGSMFTEVDQAAPGGDNGTGSQLSLPSPSLILDPSDRLVGYVDTPTELDGVVRRNRCTTSKERESGKGLTWFPDDLISLSALAAQKFYPGTTFPPGDHSNLVSFRGPAKTFPSLPIENIFVERLWQAPPFNGGACFKDKLVIVGPIAEIFQDTHRTPLGRMPGPEVQANRISTLLRNASIGETSSRYNSLVTLGMVLTALGACVVIRNVILKGFLLSLIGIGFVVTCQAVFSYQNVMVLMVSPLFGLLTTGTFGLFFQYILEWLEKHRINNVLEKYVSKNVAKTILKNPKSFVESFTGKKQKVAILFCDIRGFTTLTESVDANELVAQLNEYFSKMVHIIEEEKGGTLQKFIGDAIMAAWGDTIVRGGETDARLAIETALAMRAALIDLNQNWKGKPNRSDLSIGIGINYGEVVVGNIGSANRMEFTVLGDGINLAARFESSTKQFHTDLLVGEGAEALTRDHFVFRRVGLITFKGKTKPVEVFGVISDIKTPAPKWLPTYHEGVALFRQREFISASARFQCAEEMIGSEDFLCQMYLKACAGFVIEPPPENWDGVFVLKEK
jgi:adenylate cyclase